MSNQFNHLKTAERGAIISIVVYVGISMLKLLIGNLTSSNSLVADGYNNFTDVISSITVLVGLNTARKPADKDHPYGHWKAEPIASLITSFVMLFVGAQVFLTSITRLIQGNPAAPNLMAAWVALISALVLFIVHRYNTSLAKKTKSNGIKAVAKDNLADALTSLATAVAIFASSFGFAWLDLVMAVVVSIIILKTGVGVFKENAFSLSDGFHEEDLETYEESIASISHVKEVASIKGRMYGNQTYVDVTILVDANMTVQEGHDITEELERLLYNQFNVRFTDVHVEPDTINNQFSNEQV